MQDVCGLVLSCSSALLKYLHTTAIIATIILSHNRGHKRCEDERSLNGCSHYKAVFSFLLKVVISPHLVLWHRVVNGLDSDNLINIVWTEITEPFSKFSKTKENLVIIWKVKSDICIFSNRISFNGYFRKSSHRTCIVPVTLSLSLIQCNYIGLQLNLEPNTFYQLTHHLFQFCSIALHWKHCARKLDSEYFFDKFGRSSEIYNVLSTSNIYGFLNGWEKICNLMQKIKCLIHVLCSLLRN